MRYHHHICPASDVVSLPLMNHIPDDLSSFTSASFNIDVIKSTLPDNETLVLIKIHSNGFGKDVFNFSCHSEELKVISHLALILQSNCINRYDNLVEIDVICIGHEELPLTVAVNIDNSSDFATSMIPMYRACTARGLTVSLLSPLNLIR